MRKAWGVTQNHEEAVRLFRETVGAHPIALENLADCHEHAHGVAKDLAEAAKLYRQAAEKGWASGQKHYARVLENGLGVPAAPALAIEWYAKAANQGDAEAMQALTRLKAVNR